MGPKFAFDWMGDCKSKQDEMQQGWFGFRLPELLQAILLAPYSFESFYKPYTPTLDEKVGGLKDP